MTQQEQQQHHLQMTAGGTRNQHLVAKEHHWF